MTIIRPDGSSEILILAIGQPYPFLGLRGMGCETDIPIGKLP